MRNFFLLRTEVRYTKGGDYHGSKKEKGSTKKESSEEEKEISILLLNRKTNNPGTHVRGLFVFKKPFMYTAFCRCISNAIVIKKVFLECPFSF